jgi:cysteine desulfurase
MYGIAIAGATACVSKSLKSSPVLSAIGLPHSLAQAAIIMSLGKDNSEEDIDYVIDSFAKMVEKLRGMSPTWDDFQKSATDSLISPNHPK